MRVLVACEYSGVVRDAFTRKGHSAISCDILPTESPGHHYQGDIFDIIHDEKFDLMVAHPPCTYLCNSGNLHLHKDVNRWFKMYDGMSFFNRLLNIDIPKIAVENPIMHNYARKLIRGRGDEQYQDQIINPWMFGHKESKATCLWLKGLPKLVETDNVKEEMMLLPKNIRQRIHYYFGPDQAKVRSRTFDGIANAMAEQWG